MTRRTAIRIYTDVKKVADIIKKDLGISLTKYCSEAIQERNNQYKLKVEVPLYIPIEDLKKFNSSGPSIFASLVCDKSSLS